jgi:predicted nucleic acid-binding protein
MILDTSFIIDIMRKNKLALDKLVDFKNQNIDLIIPSVVIFELYIGLGRLNLKPEEEAKIETVIDSYTITNFNKEHAKIGGTNLGLLYTKGNPVDPIDAQIAGIALLLNDPVLTRNKDHFDRFSGLEVETYGVST